MPKWLRKRGDIWHYRFNAGGKDFCGSTEATDLPTAKLVLEETRRQAILFGIGKAAAPTLGAVSKEWLRTTQEGPHRRAAEQSREALKPLLGTPVDRFTPAMVKGWAMTYLEDHSESTCNMRLRYLRLWLRWAVKEKVIREMPCEVKEIKAQQRPRPVADLTLLDKACGPLTRNHQIRAALALAMTTGLRESELLQARWEWLNGWVMTVGGRTKNRKTRVIPLPEVARVALVQMLAAKEHGPAQLPRLGLIFPAKGGGPHKQGWLRRPLGRAGIKGLSMHRLRATFATLHLRKKANPKDVQEMLGHQDIRTTMRYSEGSLEQKSKMQDEAWA